jgi:hypothetical protein
VRREKPSEKVDPNRQVAYLSGQKRHEESQEQYESIRKPTAVKAIQREADKAGYTLQQALETCCERGWAGFKADWVMEATPKKAERFNAAEYVLDKLGMAELDQEIIEHSDNARGLDHSVSGSINSYRSLEMSMSDLVHLVSRPKLALPLSQLK